MSATITIIRKNIEDNIKEHISLCLMINFPILGVMNSTPIYNKEKQTNKYAVIANEDNTNHLCVFPHKIVIYHLQPEKY